MMLDKLTSASFRPCLQQQFRIDLDEGRYDLELIDVVEVGPENIGDRRRQFSLVFRNEREDVYLPQATYLLTHPQMGELTLFLVPLGPHDDGMRYEALFT